MNVKIKSFQDRIEALFSKASSITDFEVKGNWSKYLCVLISGFIEESMRLLFLEYAKHHSAQKIQRYIEINIRSITNCKHNRIIDLLNLFSEEWCIAYQKKISEQEIIEGQIKDSIDSIISNRHNIAHGKNVGISLIVVRNYFDNVKLAIKTLEQTIK